MFCSSHIGFTFYTYSSSISCISVQLGEGAFSVVKSATNKATGENVAIKIINRACLSICEDEAIKNEIVILKELDHDNILNFHMEVVTLSNYYLVMECL